MATVSKVSSVVVLVVMAMAVGSVPVLGLQFQVGGYKGWTKPSRNESVTYNDWATQERFHVGDTLQFKYRNDSVLVVNSSSYKGCVLSDPIFKFEDGNTVFRFDRYGFFYFISGEPGHCEAGQRLVIRVMVQTEFHPIHGPAVAPSPAQGGGDGGWGSIWAPPMNDTSKLSVASYFLTALGGVFIVLFFFIGVFIVLYLFM